MKKTIVIDLDETLIFSSLESQRDDELKLMIDDTPVYTLVRPGVQEFTRKLPKLYHCYIWSTGQPQYVNAIAKALNLTQYTIWGRDKCKYNEAAKEIDRYEKPLTQITDDLTQIAIVDNHRETFQKFPLNGIWIKTWRGDKNDTSLKNLYEYLEWLSGQNSMQRDHNNWPTESLLLQTRKKTMTNYSKSL